MASPTWSPDGSHVLVSKGDFSLRTYELWAYPLQGGNGVQVTKAKPQAKTPRNERHNALGAVYDPSGRYLYYARKLGGFAYNVKFPLWQVARRDLQNAQEDILTQTPGSAFRPKLSPNGQWLVYGTRYEQQTGLRVRNLVDGRDEWLVYPYQRDDQESRFTRDLLPGYSFTPDGKAVVGTRDGQLIRVDLATKAVAEIPFSVAVDKGVASKLYFPYRLGVGPVKARVLANMQLSPSGTQAVFASFGAIHVVDFESGAVTQLSPEGLHAAMPAWSPKGHEIAYVSFTDGKGAIYRQRANGGRQAPTANDSSWLLRVSGLVA